jgi:hypothetical protein
MGFLCTTHRENIKQNPQRAHNSWNKTLSAARQLVKENRWDQAVIFYGNALEISEIMLTQESCSMTQERYLRTAVELMHALRNSHHEYDSNALFQMVLNRLEKEEDNFNCQAQLRPLKDVAFEPLTDVNRWMTQWHELV